MERLLRAFLIIAVGEGDASVGLDPWSAAEADPMWQEEYERWNQLVETIQALDDAGRDAVRSSLMSKPATGKYTDEWIKWVLEQTA